MLKAPFRNNKGQSLIEILVGIGIAAIIIGGAAVTIGLTLRSNVQTKNVQAGTGFAQELLDQLSDFASANWHNVYDLNHAPSQYYLTSPAGTISSAGGQQSLPPVEGVVYSRYFTIENVSRDASGNVESVYNAANDDPSAQRVVITVSWPVGADTQTVSLQKILTRNRNLILHQTDWSGGGGQSGPITTVNNRYSGSAGVTVTSPAGSVKKAP